MCGFLESSADTRGMHPNRASHIKPRIAEVDDVALLCNGNSYYIVFFKW